MNHEIQLHIETTEIKAQPGPPPDWSIWTCPCGEQWLQKGHHLMASNCPKCNTQITAQEPKTQKN